MADPQSDSEPIDTLHGLLDQVEACAREGDETSVGEVVEAIGARGFSPVILLAGLVMLAPGIADIPGVPVILGLIVILVVVQMLMRRTHVWLPGWLRRRAVTNGSLRKTIGWLRTPAGYVDRWLRPRYPWAVHHAGFLVIAVCCIAVAMATPVMEVIPFSANLAGIVITAFGLALLAGDGLVALVAMAVAGGTFVFLGYQLMS